MQMIRSLKSATRKSLRLAGLDVRRARPDPTLQWLKSQGIVTILDIGANTGQFYRDIRRILPDVTVHSFEPLQDCYVELTRNGADDPHFHTHNFALGAEAGPVQMNRS